MSMLSAQCDELRSMAESVGLEVPQAATLMMGAADAIDRINDENAKLKENLEFERSENGWAREFLDRMGQKCGTKDCPSLVSYVTKMEAENAKLRELAAGLLRCMNLEDCEGCPMQDDDGWCVRDIRLRELGVEVGE